MSETDDRKPPRPVPQPVGVGSVNTVLVVLTNVPDAQCAGRIAQALVEGRLAACVNQLAPCRSLYRWQGEVESAEEIPLLIKTAQDRYPALLRRLKALHPHEVPEILAWKPDAGWPPYADWVIAQTRAPRER